MKAPNLIASVAAVLITCATLSVVNYNVAPANAYVTASNAMEITDLAPIQVRPSADELRHAALLSDIGTAGLATVPSLLPSDDASPAPLSLFGSELTMPYYSFGTKFGRITKE